MNFRDALLADRSADRMPVDMDRRLRRRLGLEVAASSRRVWLRPALAGLAVAAVALAVIAYPKQGHEVAAPTSEATIVAAPGTRVVKTSARTVLLTHGAIELKRKDATPMFVDVPVGRVVIAAYHSTITADRESVTITLYDGTGHYDDANGQSHPIAPNTPFVWPLLTTKTTKSAIPTARTPAVVSPARKQTSGTTVAAPPVEQAFEEAPPGETPPSVPPHADMPCTYKSDCDEGQTCRENERKESVCMGNGAEGAACWFDNDCLSQHCAQRRCANSGADR
jgi:hypothetical protein